MRRHTLLSVIALSLAAGGAGGFLLRAQKTDGSMVLSLKAAVQEEYLASQDSFSRVRNTRNTLDALSARYGIEIMEALWTYEQLPKGSESERKEAGQVLQRIIQSAEAAVQEFEGTAQQLQVTQSLLLALQRAGRYDRWMEVYLKALHEYPTHPFAARLATDALKYSQLAGQQEEVLQALSYIRAFDSAFAETAEIQAALNVASECFTHMECASFVANAGEAEECEHLD
jgi:hypothetical protein